MLPDLYDKLINLLTLRKQSYRLALDPESDAARRVLKDLARFCRAGESTFKENDRHHALLEGRREVWLRIVEHLEMPTEAFLAKYGGKESNE